MNVSAHIDISHVLVVDDDPKFRGLLGGFFQKVLPETKVTLWDPLSAGLPGAEFDTSDFDLLMLDFDLGSAGSGLDWLVNTKRPKLPFPATVMLTDTAEQEVAARAIKHGPEQVLNKQGLKVRALTHVITQAVAGRIVERTFAGTATMRDSIFSKERFYRGLQGLLESPPEAERCGLMWVTIRASDTNKNPPPSIESRARRLSLRLPTLLRADCEHVSLVPVGYGAMALIATRANDGATLEALAQRIREQGSASTTTQGENASDWTVAVGLVKLPGDTTDPREALREARAECHRGRKSHPSNANKPPMAPTISGPAALVYEAIAGDRLSARFRALMPLSKTAWPDTMDIFDSQLRVLDSSGSALDAAQVAEALQHAATADLVYRWQVLDAIAHLSDALEVEHCLALIVPLAETQSSGVLRALQNLRNTLEEHAARLPGWSLILELPETALQNAPEALPRIMNEYQRELGILFCLSPADNSDEYRLTKILKSMPFDMVELHTAFLNELAGNDRARAHAEAEVRAINASGALVIADGVSSGVQLTLAVTAGVHFVKGDFVAEPQESVESLGGIESMELT